MQSFIQYRRIGRDIKAQISRDQEKGHIAPVMGNSRYNNLQESCNDGVQDVAHAFPVDNPYRRTSLSSDRIQTPDSDDLVPHLDGVVAQRRTTLKGEQSQVFVVGWTCDKDRNNPHNWTKAKRVGCTLLVAYIAFVCMAASSIDSAVAPQAAEEFGVSLVVESFATAQFLLGSAAGSIITGPFSETFGRNPVYIGTMLFFMIFTMASGLSPNIGAQITFRFFAGVFGCAPLTCAGGTISDLWNGLEKIYGFPLFAIPGFGGAMLGPVIGSYIGTGNLRTWRWTEWITLIMAGVITTLLIIFLPETHPSTILSWKAQQLRLLRDDDRYQTQAEVTQMTFWNRMKVALTRPFVLSCEAIVICVTIYLTVIWAVLFTFLDGYTYLFMKRYRTSQGLTNVIFVAMYVGVLLASPLMLLVYRWTKEDLEKAKGKGLFSIRPETRLWFSMFGGAWAIPVSLFWLAWTDYVSVSIWSPIVATSLFGFGLINIFMSAYMYTIDAYEVNAASALTFATVTRFLISGGMTVAGIPFYEKVGTHWTLTIMAVISCILAPIPYLLYRYGPWVREHSQHAIRRE